MTGSTWPEQDIIDEWIKRHGLNLSHLSHNEIYELKEAVTNIRIELTEQLRAENATLTERNTVLEKDNEALRQREAELIATNKKLSDGYLRIRELLNAYDTPTAPTIEQVQEHTETKLMELMSQLEKCKEREHGSD